MASVAVLEDDATVRELLIAYLAQQGFEARGFADAQALDEALSRGDAFDALVLDWMLPGESGVQLIRRLRAREVIVPILMLTARGATDDRVAGLEAGADDYLAKPFEPRELVARLKALLRRSRFGGIAAKEPQPFCAFGPFRLDCGARRLMHPGRGEIELTAAEYALLEYFCKRPYRVLTRDELVRALRGFERDVADRSIDLRVLRLRRKIEPDPEHPVFIRTVRGMGYLFNPEGDRERCAKEL